jgi:UDP-2,3-diacylglucosamine pyrophosphatase LpxH
MHDDFGLRYVNCGDWVESCTAVAERHDGTFEIITWTQAGRDEEPAESLPQSQAA